MGKLLTVLRSGWFMTLLGLLLLALLVWTLGPLLGFAGRQPLASPLARLAAIALMGLAWAVGLLAWRLRQRARDARMGRELTAQAGAADDREAIAAAERAQLQTRFREAVGLLRRRLGRGSLYSLPWYVVIGPPGSGKSTLIRNSGLRFPLGGQFGEQALRGVGGTRNCDWWFTDEAVFLDTAGRYTTQDSDRRADAGAWADFLGLLRRFRRNRPVDGVIVTMSLSDLLLLDAAERDEHVQAIRRRLDELAEHLKVSVPVYLVFTKCDLLAGFGEFFDDLDPEQRAQVWGMSFPVDRTLDGSAVRAFADEFDLLLDRLNARLLDRLHSERDRVRRAAILSFPQQLAAFGETARQFVEGAFAGHAYGMPSLLRGVYLTSGTQEGTPIDRMMGAVARTFGVDEARMHAPGMRTRTFFVERLLKQVVFAEAGFAGIAPAEARRRALRRAACYGGIGVAAALALAAMTGSYVRNARYLAEVRAALDARPAADGAAPAADTTARFFALALQRLDAVQPALEAAERHRGDVPWSMRAGLYQGRAIGGQLRDAYLRELNAALLPGLGAQFRRGLSGNAGDLQALYYYLKGYLMLGQPQHVDAGELASLAAIEWRRLFPRDPALQAALAGHFQALLDAPERLRALPLDQAQVERARNTLRSADLPMLVYSSLKLGQQGASDDAVRLDRALGLLGDVFQRRSGAPLTAPWPALYTQPVFAAQIDGGIEAAVGRFLADDWVFAAAPADALARARTVRQVAALYEQDYIRAWDGLLEDLQLRPAADLQDASMLAAKLSGQGSPLRLLLKLVREHTTDLMRAPADASAAGAAAEQVAAAAQAAAQQAAARSAALAAALGGDDAAAAEAPGQAVEAHFAALNRLTEGEPGAMPLDRTLGVVEQLGRTLLTMTEFDAGQPNPQLLLARQEAAQLPPPVSGWVAALSGASASLVASGARDALGAQAQASIGADCAEFVQGRYPFDPDSRSEIPLQNFGELFGYGGRFDTLFRQSLEKLIDTGGRSWRWRTGPGLVEGPPGLPARMQAADRIKRHYFRDGALPEVRFTLQPATMSGRVARVAVDLDGQAFEWAADGEQAAPVRWPGPTPGRASIAAFDAAGAPLGRIAHQGDWAVLRLLHTDLARRSDLELVARFGFDGGSVELPLRAGSLRHPFLDESVRRFGCGG